MADNLEDIYCPACGKKMKKIFMPQQGVNLDVCVDGCGGIYFDNREFKKFDEPHEDITPLIEVLSGRVYETVDETKERVCPCCGNKMVRNFESSKHQVQVDECYHCGGKFLDYGELDKIRGQYNTEAERGADAIKELYSVVGKEIAELNLKHKDVEDNFIRKNNDSFYSYKSDNRNSNNILLGVLIFIVIVLIICAVFYKDAYSDLMRILTYKL